jgi:hypothetical protein
MTRRTGRIDNGRGPGASIFLQEIAISALLGLGLGFILNDLFFGLIVGLIYGLANCLAVK